MGVVGGPRGGGRLGLRAAGLGCGEVEMGCGWCVWGWCVVRLVCGGVGLWWGWSVVGLGCGEVEMGCGWCVYGWWVWGWCVWGWCVVGLRCGKGMARPQQAAWGRG